MFLIDVPPPTISGQLHLGHVFSYCHMDFVARWYNNDQPILYPFCFDCNGLPTEKLAQKSGIKTIPEIIKFAEETSKTYKDFFQTLQMSWSSHRYHSYNDNAIKLAELSFQDLKYKNLVYKDTREYFWCPSHKVSVSQSEIDDNGCYERSGEKVEIRTGEGWFINILDHVPRIREAINSIQWKPDIFRERLNRWLDDVRFDWSVSRERNYGIHIPGEPNNVVFDTWFTSSLSPQMTYASFTGVPKLSCPIFDVGFQAHDIIRTWALFTIIKSLYHNNQIPWKTIIVSGHALDKHGKKISKTANNFVDPNHYIKQYDAEGVRYWASLNQIGTDTRCDEAMMLKGKKLLNKIRNAKRFLQLGDGHGERDEYLDIWFEKRDRLSQLMRDYDWANVQKELTDFFWHTFCDVWIEDCKKYRSYNTLNKIFNELIFYYDMFFPNIKEITNAE